MKIIIPGGSGQVGTMLACHFHAVGHEVVVLSRKVIEAPWRCVCWDGKSHGAWSAEIEGADVVINLAGRSVNCRYNAKNRKEMIDSRVNSTRIVGEAIVAAVNPPKLWIQASTATIYAHRYDSPNDEESGIIGGDELGVPDTWRFSIEVAKRWEAALDQAETPRTRKVALRSAMTMSADRGGIFDVLTGLVCKGLGGTNGDGKQFVSWVHEVDFINAIEWIIKDESLAGPVNVAAPNPLPNSEFMRALRQAWGGRLGLPATRLMLEVGAIFMRTETELILKSRRVVSKKLADAGFEFQFKDWSTAAEDLARKMKERDRGG